MPQFDIEITQIFRAERKIVIPVEADDRESALETIESSASMPGFEDPRWQTGWDLQSEDVKPAPSSRNSG